MSVPSAMKEWRKAASLVEQLVGMLAGLSADGTITPAAGRVGAKIQQLEAPPMSPATWQKLLAKHVPQRVFSACTSALTKVLATYISANNSSDSTRKHAMDSNASMVCGVVLMLVERLARTAHNDLCSDTDDGQFAAPDEATAFQQQVTASGLLQLLPQLYDSLIERMHSVTGLTAELKPLQPLHAASSESSSSAGSAQPPQQQQQQQPLRQVPATTSTSSPDATLSPDTAVSTLMTLVMHALLMYANLALVWPPDVFVTEVLPGACTASALQLSWLALQLISQRLAAVQAAQLDGQAGCSRDLVMLSNMWSAVFNTMRTAFDPITVFDAAACAEGSTTQHHARIHASPHALPCAVWLVAVSVVGALLAQLPSLPQLSQGGEGSSSSNSGGGTGSTTNSDRKPASAAAYEVACKEAPHLLTTHRLLLTQLGCSPLCAVFCAAVTQRKLVNAEPYALYEDLQSSTLFCMRLMKAEPSVDAPPAGKPGTTSTAIPATAAQHQMWLLVCPVLLYWAAHQPTRIAGAAELPDCAQAVECAWHAVHTATTDQAGSQPPPLWLQQLVREEVPPLASVVAASVLRSQGCVIASSFSGSSSSKRAAATAPSTQPIVTGQQLICLLTALRATSGLEVMLGQLMEAALRGGHEGGMQWDTEQNGQDLQERLSSLLNGGLDFSTGSRGFLLEAAQVQGPATVDSLSLEQVHLASLCFSALKMPSTLYAAESDGGGPVVCLACYQRVAEVASNMLIWLAQQQQAGAGGGEQYAAGPAAVPWLVLSGRVLQCVAPLLPKPTDLPTMGAMLMLGAAQGAIAGLRAWLQTKGAADALTAAGHDPSGSLLQQLRAICALDREQRMRLQPEPLQSLGKALNTLPFACACNNPACANLSGPLELQLVNGNDCASRCSGCHVSRFCSRACQAQFWKQHRPVCRAVAAVAAGAAQAAQAAAASTAQG